MDDGVFMVRARRCLRCGRLLTSGEAIEKGYGCQCALKARKEEDDMKQIDGQINLMDLLAAREGR